MHFRLPASRGSYNSPRVFSARSLHLRNNQRLVPQFRPADIRPSTPHLVTKHKESNSTGTQSEGPALIELHCHVYMPQSPESTAEWRLLGISPPSSRRLVPEKVKWLLWNREPPFDILWSYTFSALAIVRGIIQVPRLNLGDISGLSRRLLFSVNPS